MIKKEIIRLERYVHQGLHSGSVPPPEIIKWRGLHNIASDVYEYVNSQPRHSADEAAETEEDEKNKRDILLSKQIILNNLKD